MKIVNFKKNTDNHIKMAIITGFTVWAQTYPLYSIVLVSFLITLFTTVIYKYVSDQKTMKILKDEIKLLQKEMKEVKDNPKKILDKQKELMEKNFSMMKHSLKPSLYTALPLLLIFYFIRNVYINTGAVLFNLTWIWAYIIFSIIFSLIIRKIMKVY